MGNITYNDHEYEPFLVIYRRAGARFGSGAGPEQFLAKYADRESPFAEFVGVAPAPIHAFCMLDLKTTEQYFKEYGAINGRKTERGSEASQEDASPLFGG